MPITLHRNLLLAIAWLTLATAAHAGPMPAIRHGQLLVDGQPFLALGGELHNSSASSPEYMMPIWAKLQAMHVRTVIGTVSWYDFEPVEGHYDYHLIDAQIAQARQHDIHLVLIWFGAFKNASSTYAPVWVRGNAGRFPRSVAQGQMSEAFTYLGAMPKPVLSVFSPALMRADGAAFAMMMRHLAQADPEHRVIMVQINNETGMLHDSRDRSALANAAWGQPVPPALLRYLASHRATLRPEVQAVWARQGHRMAGTWTDVFGTDWQADEVFMAWHFASYMQALAEAGKSALPLPMYVNGWLGPQDGQPTAGYYPSGGPGKRVLDIWQAAAPDIDMLSPDLYVPDVKDPLADYDRPGNPVFVPESQVRTGNLFWALGQHRAVGYSIFGIEDVRLNSQLAQALGVLAHMDGEIATAQAAHRIAGVLIDDGQPAKIHLGGYTITVRETQKLFQQMMLDAGLQAPPPPPTLPNETQEGPGPPSPADSRAFGLIIDEGGGRFLIVGKGFTADFADASGLVEIDRVEEGQFNASGWKPGRVINGDERLSIIPMDHIGVVRISLLKRSR